MSNVTEIPPPVVVLAALDFQMNDSFACFAIIILIIKCTPLAI